ncbi:MAG: helix-turn-helix transcriptional regulator [Lachnospiraceae bacterium]|nr:helix-turn-helix transcriptional regulator [Lachnospiraceae bacterium]
MISYDPFWITMKEQKVTQYQLIYHWNISSNTIRRMKRNEPISTTTLNELCLILNCSVDKILTFAPTDEELELLEQCKTKTKSR